MIACLRISNLSHLADIRTFALKPWGQPIPERLSLSALAILL
jgi:hypothetical protein